MPEPLTPVQLKTLRLIDESVSKRGIGPHIYTMQQEINMDGQGRVLRVSRRSSVFRILRILEKKGWITRKPHRARMITVLHKPPPCDEPEVEVTEAGRAEILESPKPARHHPR